MALQKTTQNFPLVQGIDTKTDPFQLNIGQLSTLENGVFTNTKEIRKRNGYSPFPTTIESTGNISSPQAITTFKNELIEIANNNLYSFSEGTNKFTSKGQLISVVVTNTAVDSESAPNDSDANQDGAYHPNALFLTCWETLQTTTSITSPENSYYTITDYETSEIIAPRVALEDNAINPKAFAIGGYFIVFYVVSNTNTLKMLSIPAGTPLLPNSPVTFSTGLSSDSFYDVCILAGRVFVAYNSSTGVAIRYTDSSLAISPATTLGGETASGCIGVFGDTSNNTVWVTYYDGTRVRATQFSYSLATTLSPITIDTLTGVRNTNGYASAGTATIYYEVYTTDTNAIAGYYLKILKNTCTSAGVVGSPSLFLMNVGLVSKFFLNGTSRYVIVSFQSILQGTYFVVDTSGRVISKILQATAGGFTNLVYLANYTSSTLCEVNTVSTNNFAVALLQQKGGQYFRNLTTQNQGQFAQNIILGAIYSSLSFNSSTYENVDIANGLYIVGGVVSLYDGVGVTEAGFNLYPEGSTVDGNGSGGHLSDGTYSYKATYEWIDNFGQLNRSAPSPLGDSLTLSGGGSSQSSNLKIPTLPFTLKTSVQIVVYRTNANGTAYYRLPVVIANDPTAPYVNYLDSSPSDNSGYVELYTDTGEVDNIPLPPVNLITTFKTRVVAVPTESTSSFWYSKDVVPGVPAEFSDSFIWNITTIGGGITALHQMDDKLILFKKYQIFYMVGSGPALNGSNNDFTDAQIIPSDVGCVNPASVVLTPIGLFFDSAKGRYLLDRSLNVSYIGAPVEAYNQFSITSAILLPNYREVRFTLSNSTALVFNYFIGQWSVFTNISAISASIWEGLYTYLNSTQVMQEAVGTFTDNGSFIKMKIVTGWLNFSSVQGFQRIWKFLIFGTARSAHTLQVYLNFDYNPNTFQSSQIDATSLDGTAYGADSPYGSGSPYGGDYLGLYQWDVRNIIQRCESMQIWIEDTETSPYGEGYSLSNLEFELGVEGGAMRLPASKQIG